MIPAFDDCILGLIVWTFFAVVAGWVEGFIARFEGVFVVRVVEKWRRNRLVQRDPSHSPSRSSARLETPVIPPFDDQILGLVLCTFCRCWGLRGGVRFEGVFAVCSCDCLSLLFIEKWKRNNQACQERPIAFTIEDFNKARNTSDCRLTTEYRLLGFSGLFFAVVGIWGVRERGLV